MRTDGEHGILQLLDPGGVGRGGGGDLKGLARLNPRVGGPEIRPWCTAYFRISGLSQHSSLRHGVQRPRQLLVELASRD